VSRTSVNYFTKKIKKFYDKSNRVEFLQGIWAIDRIQSNFPKYGFRYIIDLPEEAKTIDLSSSFHFAKWKLEELVNLDFVLSSQRYKPSTIQRRCDFSRWGTLARLFDYQLKLQNSQSGLELKNIDVLDTMHRLAHQQFRWQKGVFNRTYLIRTGFVFSGPKASNFMEATYGYDIRSLQHYIFILYLRYLTTPILEIEYNGSKEEKIARSMISKYSCSFEFAENEIRKIRGRKKLSEFGRSIIREYPLLSVGNDQYICPLPSLLLLRVTNGIYYDTIAAKDDISGEIGSNFENYCFGFLQGSFQNFIVHEGYNYGTKKLPNFSPDLLVESDGAIHLICECKATRMTHDNMNLVVNEQNQDKAIEELSKGVFQVWKYYKHSQEISECKYKVDEHATGVVITLDGWTQLRFGLYEKVLIRANERAEEAGILQKHRIDVGLCDIEDFESLCIQTNEKFFLSSLRNFAKDKSDFKWSPAQRFREDNPNDIVNKPNPYLSRFDQIVPWFHKGPEGLKKSLGMN